MTWEETIIYVRELESYKQLIEDSYLHSDLKKNVEKFKESSEFKETLRFIDKYQNSRKQNDPIRLLDLGAGNGISSISFALNNYQVTAVEPDSSATVGFGAINSLKKAYDLDKLEVLPSYGESLPFENGSFDVVYARQAMHHANDLKQFVKEAGRVLKKGGVLFTIRDHVVNDKFQKSEFLKNHPLESFYKGENAFSLEEYKNAISSARLSPLLQLGPLDSIINYSPLSKSDLLLEFKQIFHRKTGITIPDTEPFNTFIFKLFKWKTNNLKNNAGRLYSFIARKN